VTSANGINNQDQIVGVYVDADGAEHGFLLSRGTFTTIDVPNSVTTDAFGINDRGQIVGLFVDTNGAVHGFLATPKVEGLVFAGTPGMPNCHGKSVSALAQQFGGLDAAAAALGFPSVHALQDSIRAFCEG
jgi:probable HAF family extracellular repeat protein